MRSMSWSSVAGLDARLVAALEEGVRGLRLELLRYIGIDKRLKGIGHCSGKIGTDEFLLCCILLSELKEIHTRIQLTPF